jgi:hypothetical protein
MLKKLLSAIGNKSKSAHKGKGPYSDDSINLIYKLLFCDNLQLFKDNHRGELKSSWPILFNDHPEIGSLIKIAENSDAEPRVRALAFGLS